MAASIEKDPVFLLDTSRREAVRMLEPDHDLVDLTVLLSHCYRLGHHTFINLMDLMGLLNQFIIAPIEWW